MKNKTLALWLTLLAGPLGLHRLYLKGRFDAISWLLAIASVLGLIGVWRARDLGLDDEISWLLIPFLGLSVAASALTAIVYGLSDAEAWNRRHNPMASAEHAAGQTGWPTVAGLVLALLLGSTVLLSSIAFSFQRYFEYQASEATAPAGEPARKPAE